MARRPGSSTERERGALQLASVAVVAGFVRLCTAKHKNRQWAGRNPCRSHKEDSAACFAFRLPSPLFYFPKAYTTSCTKRYSSFPPLYSSLLSQLISGQLMNLVTGPGINSSWPTSSLRRYILDNNTDRLSWGQQL